MTESTDRLRKDDLKGVNMPGHYTIPKLLGRWTYWSFTHDKLWAIKYVINNPPLNTNTRCLPQNMKQRMADLLQLELVIRKLL
jgi:hypothetical protein